MSEREYKLATHHYPCTSQESLPEDIVLLHGWGTNTDSWLPLIPALERVANIIAVDLPGFGGSGAIADFTLDKILCLLADQLPEKCVLIGWSLGGMLAVQLAARWPEKIIKIITLAANAKFVASGDYPTAMTLTVNNQFNQHFSADPQAALKLFCGLLSQGDANERALQKKVRSLISPQSVNSNWMQALELLAEIDNRDFLGLLPQEGLHVLAEKDVLVPVGAHTFFESLHSAQQVNIIPASAHALHWSNPELVAQLITTFLVKELPVLDKKQVAYSFSRAAHTYDSVANLQRSAGGQLLQYIEQNSDVEVVLDLGCGTGHFMSSLQGLFTQALVVGVDIAEGMLQFAHEHHGAQKNWLCADADYLPLASNSVDVIFSNFALQWCTDLPHLLAELHRVLKPGGHCIFTSLGPATLHELKTAWAQVDTHVHVNQFHESALLLRYLQQADFEIMCFDNHIEVMSFENLTDLTRSLQCLGAQNVNRGRATGLTGRKKIQAFRQAYENFRTGDVLPATYDIFYLKVKK